MSELLLPGVLLLIGSEPAEDAKREFSIPLVRM